MSSYNTINEIDLLNLLRLGDNRAFTEVFNRYWDKMYIHALRMLEDEDEAKDLVQDIFASLWTKCNELQLHTNLAGYLYVATRNKVLNYIRQKKTRAGFEDALALYIDQNQYSVIDKICEKELASALESEITHLPEKMRKVFELSRYIHLSHKEIGLQLNITDHTVKKQIGNALKILRIKMKLEGTITIIFLTGYLFK
ncbi:putative RNA polymerase ECF-type sigma factor [Arcticibacter svalbardensis MN12-7]|uniref:Putative RNA polymerase ECF-type sigma factor n=1 Tax=Arcticibacter svalbardensis MN12-7 TaxID=1150600 RepID=R9H2R1_9SPHI|nr:RNA polymerase sigma-70 factor [Arcticibacter svalbardensis]EOR95499.1 putative RNA polymerase ECF-type sigma factor [Arcticibacter svalbardensis MN12-7]